MDVFYQHQNKCHIIFSALFKQAGLRSATPSDKLISPRGREGSAFGGGFVLPGTKLPWTTSLYAHQLSSSLGVRGWAVERRQRERVTERFYSRTCTPLKSNGCQMGKGISSALWVKGGGDVQVHFQCWGSCGPAVVAAGTLIRFIRENVKMHWASKWEV